MVTDDRQIDQMRPGLVLSKVTICTDHDSKPGPRIGPVICPWRCREYIALSKWITQIGQLAFHRKLATYKTCPFSTIKGCAQRYAAFHTPSWLRWMMN